MPRLPSRSCEITHGRACIARELALDAFTYARVSVTLPAVLAVDASQASPSASPRGVFSAVGICGALGLDVALREAI